MKKTIPITALPSLGDKTFQLRETTLSMQPTVYDGAVFT